MPAAKTSVSRVRQNRTHGSMRRREEARPVGNAARPRHLALPRHFRRDRQERGRGQLVEAVDHRVLRRFFPKRRNRRVALGVSFLVRAPGDPLLGRPTISGLVHLASPRFGRRSKSEPLQTLRESLEGARASGMDFDSAWEASVEGALTGYRGLVRDDWNCAIRETREVWRAAYVGEANGRLERWAGLLQTP
jgi:hypothetical protein